jgi:hypothetical protein
MFSVYDALWKAAREGEVGERFQELAIKDDG